MKDTRIAYGARCTWWDSISKVGKLGNQPFPSLPCCPHCKGMLFEMDDEAMWWKAVDNEEKKEPGYRKFIEWMRGKCYHTIEEARLYYAKSLLPKKKEVE